MTAESPSGRLAELAAQCESVTSGVNALLDQMLASDDEATRRVAKQLFSASQWLADISVGLRRSSDHLDRARGRRVCSVEWGTCPVHGGKLERDEDPARSWCFECDLEWLYDRPALPCDEPAVYRVTMDGRTMLMCQGHVTTLRDEDGCTFAAEPLDQTPGATA